MATWPRIVGADFAGRASMVIFSPCARTIAGWAMFAANTAIRKLCEAAICRGLKNMGCEYPQSPSKWSAAVAAPSIKQFKPQSGIRALVNPRFRHDDELSAELRIPGFFRQPHKPICLLLKEFHFLRGHFLRSAAQTRRFLIRTQIPRVRVDSVGQLALIKQDDLRQARRTRCLLDCRIRAPKLSFDAFLLTGVEGCALTMNDA